MKSERKPKHQRYYEAYFRDGYRAGLEAAADILYKHDSPSVLLLAAGEMTAQEMRTARAVLRLVEVKIRELKKGAAK